MVNYHAQFRQLLQQAAGDVTVYYDNFKEKTAIPCISYAESGNATTAKGDTLKFSDISFLVKIWVADDIATLIQLADSIDEVLENNGFTRTFANEVEDNDLTVKILRYNATGFEKKQ